GNSPIGPESVSAHAPFGAPVPTGSDKAGQEWSGARQAALAASYPRMRSAGPWLSSSRLFCGARRCWLGLFGLKWPRDCRSGSDLITRVPLDDRADAAAYFSEAPRRSRDWWCPDRRLPWLDEKRGDAPFWRLRLASRPRREA